LTDEGAIADEGPEVEGRLLFLLFVLALAWNLAVGAIGWRHALSDSFGFRQTQTALSTWALLEGGPFWAYETPVLGPPWSVPMELPVYQGAVALVVRATGLPLEPAGRLVSRAFLYAALPAVWLLLAELAVRPAHRQVFLILWLANPYYAYWSRTFMMETTAVFFGLAFLTFALRFLARGGLGDAMLAVASGSLCATVKSTTFPGFLGLAALAAAFRLIGRTERPRSPAFLPLLGLVLLLPLAAGYVWSAWADALKSQNPLAAPLRSGDVIGSWLFGPGADGWGVALARLRAMVAEIAGGPVVLGLALAAALAARRRLAPLAACLAAFLGVLFVFLRFHVVHLYYPCANGLFLIGAVGFGVLALFERPGRGRLLGWLLLALALGFGLRTYHAEFERVQRRDAYAGPNQTVRLARGLAAITSGTDVILGFGLDWSPEVPYYAGRRALMWPGHLPPSGEPLLGALDRLESYRVGAVFACREGSLPADSLAVLERRLPLSPVPRQRVGDCEVFSRADATGAR
jgi:hypothetical protein